MIIDTGFRLHKDVPYPFPPDIVKDNVRGNPKRVSEGDNMRAMTASKRMDDQARNLLFSMNKAILIVAGKRNITREIPNDEVGESDLPKGKLKYDEVPDGPNMLGQGGAGKVICNEPLRNGGGMVPNSVFGNEMMRVLIGASEKVKGHPDKKTKKVEDALKKADMWQNLRDAASLVSGSGGKTVQNRISPPPEIPNFISREDYTRPFSLGNQSRANSMYDAEVTKRKQPTAPVQQARASTAKNVEAFNAGQAKRATGVPMAMASSAPKAPSAVAKSHDLLTPSILDLWDMEKATTKSGLSMTEAGRGSAIASGTLPESTPHPGTSAWHQANNTLGKQTVRAVPSPNIGQSIVDVANKTKQQVLSKPSPIKSSEIKAPSYRVDV